MDTITLGAFVRSGNHFFQHLVRTALIDVRCDWLSHRMSDWDGKSNRVTVVRNPLDCVSSWISTCKDERADRSSKVLEWYVSYHKQVDALGIFVVPFDSLIQDSLGSINKVCADFGLNRSFFSSNDTLAKAMESSEDFVWANDNKDDYPQIHKEILANRLYVDAVKMYDKLVR